MERARPAILAHGGAGHVNVFTRILLALFGELDWRRPGHAGRDHASAAWFAFHLDKISYWSRTVIVPLLVLMALKPRARNPRGVTFESCSSRPPAHDRSAAAAAGLDLGCAFRAPRRVLRMVEPLFPEGAAPARDRRGRRFVTERLNGEDGLGAIYPAMANTVMMFDCLGYPKDDPHLVTAQAALRQARW